MNTDNLITNEFQWRQACTGFRLVQRMGECVEVLICYIPDFYVLEFGANNSTYSCGKET